MTWRVAIISVRLLVRLARDCAVRVPPPLLHCRCLDEVITVAAMLSADHVFSSASGLTGPQQGQGGPTDAARKLQDLAAQVRGRGCGRHRPLALVSWFTNCFWRRVSRT